MKWPWVSRALLERVEEQLKRSEAERLDLMQQLLARPEIVTPKQTEEASEPAAFTTPFDRVERNFYAALRQGKVSQRHRARMR